MNKSPYPEYQVAMFWNALIEHCKAMTACIGCPLVEQCKALNEGAKEFQVVPSYWEKAEVKK